MFVLLKYFIAIGPQLRGFPIYTRLSCAVNYPLSWFKGKFKFNELIQKESCKDVFYPKNFFNKLLKIQKDIKSFKKLKIWFID